MGYRNNTGGTLLGVLIGLVFGVLMSLGVVWYLNKMPIPFQDKTNHAERAASGDGGVNPPVALPGKPGDKVGEKPADKAAGDKGGDKSTDKPRFEFYKILPGNQEATPAAKTDPKAGAEPIYLQAGAFQKPADADNLKAKLALMGIEASVQEADIPEKGKMFRVRVGPFSSTDEMNRARAQLSQDGVTTSPVKGN